MEKIVLLRWSDFAFQTYTEEQLTKWRIRDKFDFPAEATIEDEKIFVLGDVEIKYSHRLFDYVKQEDMKVLFKFMENTPGILKTALLLLFFLLFPSCVKESISPKCENEIGLVTYWVRYPISDDTLHLTNLGFKTCDEKYYKLSEATMTIKDGVLVDTAFANLVDFNFVRFKPLKFD